MEVRITRLLILVLLTITGQLFAQNFVRITDPDNPLSQTNLLDYWTGAAWIDVDNDDDLDLFLTNRQPGTTQRKNQLYVNEDGGLVRIDTGILVNDLGYWFGCSWGDYDNDGDLDAHVAGFPAQLYRNDGNLQFTKVTTGTPAQDTPAGISTAWGDFNRDGYLDLFTVWPIWLPGPPWLGAPGAPYLLINDGPPNFSFTRLTGSPITELAPDTYLHTTLVDFDGDHDLDIFIGMGAGVPKPDLLYRNLLSETDSLHFEPMTEPLIATDQVEGNQWSWIDVDNDGDLDGFLTNWAHVVDDVTMPETNNLYINEGGGFTKVTTDVITTDANLSTTNTWGDYDNDGDLDCIVVTDSTFQLYYYKNDGSGNFERVAAGELGSTNLHQSGCSHGDFDKDGDLDLFVPGAGSNSAFFRNDLDNGNHWVTFKLLGTSSNRAAIGAKIFLKSTIDGGQVWQQREVSASNTFFGHNSLWQHFGLGDADVVDSLRIEWPSGAVDHYHFLGVDAFYTLTEGEGIFPTKIEASTFAGKTLHVFPNPAKERFTVEVTRRVSSSFELVLVDSLTGRIVERVPREPMSQDSILVEMTLDHGAGIVPCVYVVALVVDGKNRAVQKVVVY